MKKVIILSMLMTIFMIGVSHAQTITVTSGGDIIASGVNVSGDTTVCDSSSISFTVSFDGGIDHVSWVSNPSGQTFTPSSTNVTVSVTPTENSSYIVYVYGPNPTDYVGYVRINVIVADLPLEQTLTTNGTVGINGEYCADESGVIFGCQNSEVGATYQIQEFGTSTNVGSAVAGTGTAITFDAVPAGDYQLYVTNASGCSITQTTNP